MKTILQSGLSKDVVSTSEVNPFIGVSDNHLLVSTRPSRFGVFQSDAGQLPSKAARFFRITNSGASPITVKQRTPILFRSFNEGSLEMDVDSNTIRITSEVHETPRGQSGVMSMIFAGDSASYVEVNLPEKIFGIQSYFKIIEVPDTGYIRPFGVYTTRPSIDINFPAYALGAYKDGGLIKLKQFSKDQELDFTDGNPVVDLNKWYRVTLSTKEQSGNPVFDVVLQKETFSGSGELSSVREENGIVSTGSGSLADIFSNFNFFQAFSSDGAGSQQIEGLLVYRENSDSETLLPNNTKEYYCVSSLDEYIVSGQVTGYFTL